ncbi:MAG: cysteine hydrolase [Proteobacteria bacterium]|nr:cysteine hydrolase [Pseudomonadota bacterium]
MTVALVLLDLQVGLVRSPRIAWEDPATPGRAIEAARALLDAARGNGVPVIHVGVVRPHARGQFDTPRTMVARKSGRIPRDVAPLEAGSDDTAFVLVPGPGEEVVHKVGVSAFQGTRLDALLRNAGIHDVVVAGAFTHMVVESTVRQGFDLGYRMTVVTDACCAPVAAAHQAAMTVGIPSFAIVAGLEESVALLAQGRAGG